MAMQEEVMQCQTCGCGFSTMSRSLSAPNSLGTVVTLNVIRYTLLLSSPEFVCYCKFTGWLYIIWHQSVQFRDNKNEILSLVYIYVNI